LSEIDYYNTNAREYPFYAAFPLPLYLIITALISYYM